jgi:hypothetical protein
MNADANDPIVQWVQRNLNLSNAEIQQSRIVVTDEGGEIGITVEFPDDGLKVEEHHRQAILKKLRVSSADCEEEE